MTATKGKDLALYIGGGLVALSKSCDIEVTADIVEVSNILSGRIKKHIVGRYGWQISSSALVSADGADFFSLLDKLKKGTRVAVGVTTPSSPRLAGYALVQSLRESGNLGNMATYNVVLLGDSELDAE